MIWRNKMSLEERQKKLNKLATTKESEEAREELREKNNEREAQNRQDAERKRKADFFKNYH